MNKGLILKTTLGVIILIGLLVLASDYCLSKKDISSLKQDRVMQKEEINKILARLDSCNKKEIEFQNQQKVIVDHLIEVSNYVAELKKQDDAKILKDMRKDAGAMIAKNYGVESPLIIDKPMEKKEEKGSMLNPINWFR